MKRTVEINFEFTSKAALRSDGTLAYSLTVTVPRMEGKGADVGYTEHAISPEIQAELTAVLQKAADSVLETTLSKAQRGAAVTPPYEIVEDAEATAKTK
jgi:hypothetical protein